MMTTTKKLECKQSRATDTTTEVTVTIFGGETPAATASSASCSWIKRCLCRSHGTVADGASATAMR